MAFENACPPNLVDKSLHVVVPRDENACVPKTSFGFPKTSRLTKQDFRSMRAISTKAINAGFVAFYKKNNQNARLGIIVSKRMCQKAVDRNRIKRKIRESFRLQKAHLPSYDILIIARAKARAFSAPQFQAQMTKIWQSLPHP